MNYDARFMQTRGIVPLAAESSPVTVGGTVAPDDELRRLLQAHHLLPVRFEQLDRDDLLIRIQRSAAAETDAEQSPCDAATDSAIYGARDGQPAVNLVNSLLNDALRHGASDIHLESRRDRVSVRYRIDGRLRDAESCATRTAGSPDPIVLPHRFRAVSSRLKVLAGLNGAERRRPQDGRFTARLPDDLVDVRFSSVPTISGESIVLRLFRLGSERYRLEQLGMPGEVLDRVIQAIERPAGFIVISGPTGSGKTTTLHAALTRIAGLERKIITIEDPVEYRLDGVEQIQTNEAAGLTFESILRRVLRQDPDVIMVGEIRDRPTAGLAARAALTGHLVLATVHARHAADVPDRLADLGVERSLIARLQPLCLAQRLVRRLCRCGGAPGCAACRGSGFRGRIGLFEMTAAGYPACRFVQDGRQKVLDGVTTEEEVLWETA